MLDYLVLGIAGIGVLGFIGLTAWRMRHEQPDREVPPAPPKCRHDVQSRARWTQDGWVTVCLVCREWIYHGDDYEKDRPA